MNAVTRKVLGFLACAAGVALGLAAADLIDPPEDGE